MNYLKKMGQLCNKQPQGTTYLNKNMTSFNWLKLQIYAGIGIMLMAFIILPDGYPWYAELILFNIGMFLWLFGKSKMKQLNTPA